MTMYFYHLLMLQNYVSVFDFYVGNKNNHFYNTNNNIVGRFN